VDEDTDTLLGIRQRRAEETEIDSLHFSSHPSGFDSVSTGRPVECTSVSTLEKSRPIRQPPKWLPRAKQAEVSKVLKDMQRREVIEESIRPGNLPLFSSGRPFLRGLQEVQ
jgi:hypothetical protein